MAWNTRSTSMSCRGVSIFMLVSVLVLVLPLLPLPLAMATNDHDLRVERTLARVSINTRSNEGTHTHTDTRTRAAAIKQLSGERDENLAAVLGAEDDSLSRSYRHIDFIDRVFGVRRSLSRVQAHKRPTFMRGDFDFDFCYFVVVLFAPAAALSLSRASGRSAVMHHNNGGLSAFGGGGGATTQPPSQATATSFFGAVRSMLHSSLARDIHTRLPHAAATAAGSGL